MAKSKKNQSTKNIETKLDSVLVKAIKDNTLQDKFVEKKEADEKVDVSEKMNATADKWMRTSITDLSFKDGFYSFVEHSSYGLNTTERKLNFGDAYIYDAVMGFQNIKNAVHTLFNILQEGKELTWDDMVNQSTISVTETLNGYSYERVTELAKHKEALELVDALTDNEKIALFDICSNFCEREFNGKSTFEECDTSLTYKRGDYLRVVAFGGVNWCRVYSADVNGYTSVTDGGKELILMLNGWVSRKAARAEISEVMLKNIDASYDKFTETAIEDREKFEKRDAVQAEKEAKAKEGRAAKEALYKELFDKLKAAEAAGDEVLITAFEEELKSTTGLTKARRGDLVKAKNAMKVTKSVNDYKALVELHKELDTLAQCDALAVAANSLNLEKEEKNLVRNLIRDAKAKIKAAQKDAELLAKEEADAVEVDLVEVTKE